MPHVAVQAVRDQVVPRSVWIRITEEKKGLTAIAQIATAARRLPPAGRPAWSAPRVSPVEATDVQTGLTNCPAPPARTTVNRRSFPPGREGTRGQVGFHHRRPMSADAAQTPGPEPGQVPAPRTGEENAERGRRDESGKDAEVSFSPRQPVPR
jgi:hypothetical protein